MKAKKSLWLKYTLLSSAIVPFIGGVSTVNAVYGTSALPAMAIDQRQKADEWAAHSKLASGDANKSSAARAAISPINKSLCNMARIELNSGVLSGSAGPGAISAAYAAACSYTDEILVTISSIETAQLTRRADVNALVDQLREITDRDDLGPFEKRREFKRLAGQIEAQLSEAALADVQGTLSTQLKGLEASVIAADVKDGEFGDKQAAAIEALRAYFGQIREAVGELLVSKVPVTTSQPEPLVPMGRAIIRYRDQLWPGIILAIAIDCAVLWFAFSLALSNQVLKLRRNAVTGALHWLDLPFVKPPVSGRANGKDEDNRSDRKGS